MNQQELLKQLNKEKSLNEIQSYIKEVIKIRGFENQETEKAMLLLVEEVGELAKEVRKKAKGMSLENGPKDSDSIEEEIADVFIVLVSICNTLNINLFNALIKKEQINMNRTWKINK
ncbi:MAG: hypothetical protein FWE36_04170 [Erysipelotrichales bacterium]|nr:hypothetical protein [Erysipelotrichales bacterium]